jgi:hypothetical protein
MTQLIRRGIAVAAVLGATGAAAAVSVASADGDHSRTPQVLKVQLSGFQEDPLALSTTGKGSLRLTTNPRAGTISYTLRYSGLEGAVTQAHIHLGGRAQSGGISAFLCSNLGNGPAGTKACPAAPGEVTGTLTAADVIGPAGQGITAGQIDELLAAMRAETTYVNVHSTLYPGGEIRSQLVDHRH